METDCETKNYSFLEHHDIIKKRGNQKRKANNAKHKALKQKKFDFNVCSFAKLNTFIRYDSFYDNMIKTAAIGKG